mmetsp:Transcript_120989/g.342329  ORF Transcript_120989/g.342329 Transcript_120989/m.342329 type:complete len:243 (-) Transcript_120989:1250-1978(-)
MAWGATAGQRPRRTNRASAIRKGPAPRRIRQATRKTGSRCGLLDNSRTTRQARGRTAHLLSGAKTEGTTVLRGASRTLAKPCSGLRATSKSLPQPRRGRRWCRMLCTRPRDRPRPVSRNTSSVLAELARRRHQGDRRHPYQRRRWHALRRRRRSRTHPEHVSPQRRGTRSPSAFARRLLARMLGLTGAATAARRRATKRSPGCHPSPIPRNRRFRRPPRARLCRSWKCRARRHRGHRLQGVV